MKITLADQRSAYNFHSGLVMRMTDSGRLVPMTRRERAADRARRMWFSATRWWRPRSVVAAVDCDEGTICFVTERWSWLRLHWERIE